MKKLGIVFSVIIAVSLTLWPGPSASAEISDGLGDTRDITVTLEAGPYEISEVGKYSVIEMEGFGSILNPGEPKLPTKTFLIGLPPGAEAVSVDIVASDYAEIPGEYRILPAPPIVSGQEGEKVKWGENEEIYSSESAYPSSAYEYLGMGQMRKYNFARVRFSPIVYYPATGKLGLYHSITLRIKYEISQVVPPELLSDTVMDDVASQIITNYPSIKSKYQSAVVPSAVSYNYMIITTDSLQSAVQPLVTWKTAIGYSAKVVTTSWISTNYSGRDLPEKIRNFLIDKYAEWGIEYVLIVGSHSTIPMRYCYPDPTDHDLNSDSTTPTDYYYADLTGNWDSDGDGYFGEYGQDNVDFYPEVYVGRIPFDDSATVSSVCQKSVSFEQDGGAWKKKALLLGAIANYEGELFQGYSLPRTDGAALMEECWNDILSGDGYSRERMYEKEGLSPSTYACEHPLTKSNVLNASYGWPSGYGIVNWVAHGNLFGAYRQVWEWDDGDGVPEFNEIDSEIDKDYCIIHDTDASSLDDSKPAIVFSCSCYTGYPEEASSLGNSLLQQGAVAFVGATRSPRYIAEWENGGDGGCESTDYGFFYYLVNYNRKCGDALYLSQVWNCDYLSWYDWSFWQNIFAFCLYGDPSLGTATISESEPTISYSPQGLGWVIPEGYEPAPMLLDIWNSGGGILNWSVTDDANWLTLSPTSGSSTGETDGVTVLANSSGMSAGDYSATITISALAATNSPQPVPVDLYIYAPGNNPPNTPSNPSPADHATGVSINADLSWTGGDPDVGDTVTYDVYFGTSAAPPLVSNDRTGTTYDLGVLDYNTKYYWKVVASDNHGATTEGPVWDFTTGSPANNPPQLSSGYVDPLSGHPSTDFYYYVNYYDSDGDSPTIKYFRIDGTAYPMSLYSGTASNGVYRYGPKNLAVGSHNYYFYFGDGKGGTARLPISGSYSGPSVSWGEFNPDFEANPREGNAPLEVEFDPTWTTDGALPYVKAEWDFNGDGIIDQIKPGANTMDIVTHTYTGVGTYTISLTITDSSTPEPLVQTMTKIDYIMVIGEAASVSIKPQSQTVAPGGTFNVDVWVDAVGRDLNGIDIAVQYNSDAMTTSVADVEGHNLLGGLEIPAAVNEVAGVGEVTYQLASGTVVGGIDASVMTIQFTMDAGAAPGTYDLTVSRGTLIEPPDATEIAGVETNDGTVTVGIGRKGDFNGDGAIDIFDFVLFAAVYGT